MDSEDEGDVEEIVFVNWKGTLLVLVTEVVLVLFED